ALKDPHPLIRENATRSLAESTNAETFAELKPLLNDPSCNVRVAAAWALRATVDLKSKAGIELLNALELDADQPSGQFRTAMLELARKQPEEALSHLQKAVAWDPYSPPLHFELAQLLAQMGRTAEARAAANQTLKLHPGFKPAEELMQRLSTGPQ